MQNEILKPVLATDETAIPRYDIVNPDGSVTQQNVELRLKNQVIQEGTPYDEESVLPAKLATQLGLPTTATPAQALQLLFTKSYNKDETLSNATKTLFGLGASAVPNDVLAILSKAVQYSWFRRVNRDSTTEVKTQYTVSANNGWNEKCCSLQLSSTAVSAVQYSETVAFDADGTPYLKNPKTVNVSYDNYTAANIISGKYFYKNSKGSVITSTVYYAEPGQGASRHSSNGAYSVYFSKTSIITGIPTNETGDWERLFSDNRNAYPTGIVGEYEYVFADTILTYSGAPIKIGTISYTGAGNTGDKSIVFPIGPKIIFISRSDGAYMYFPYVWGTPVLFGINATSSSFNKVGYNVSLRGTTLTASSSSSSVHGLDASGVVYTITYIA